MNIFKEESGKWSSKRVVGILGVAVILVFAYLGRGSDTLILGLFAGFVSMIVATAFSKPTLGSRDTGGELPPDDDEHKRR